MSEFYYLGVCSLEKIKILRDAGELLPFETFSFKPDPYKIGFGFIRPDGNLSVSFCKADKMLQFSEIELGFCKRAIERTLERGWVEDNGVCFCMHCGYKPKMLEEIKSPCPCFNVIDKKP